MATNERQKNSGVERLDKSRKEVRFTGTTEPEVLASSGIREIFYPDNVVSSLYLNSTKFAPERGSVRVRFRSNHRPPHDLLVFDPEQVGTLEVKLRPQKEEAEGEKIRKYSIRNVPIGEIINAVRTPENFQELNKYPNGAHIRRMIEILFQGDGLEPLLMTQAERRHFIHDQESVRMTLDKNTSYWLPNVDKGVLDKEGLLLARRAETIPMNVLEIKKDHGTDEVSPEYNEALVAELFGQDNDYTLGDRVKRSHGIHLFFTNGRPTRINPEAKAIEERHEIVEREEKIDIDQDPRSFIKTLPMNLSPDLYVGPANGYPIYFRYIQVSPTVTVCEKSFSPNFEPEITGFQYKAPLSEDGVSVRLEKSAKSLSALLKIICEKKDDLLPVTQSAIAARNRVERAVVCEDTGNVFTLLADHCTADDDRDPLNQIEIEYQGRLDFPNIPQKPTDPAQIASDFNRIGNALKTSLTEQNISILDTKTKKEEWLSN